MRDVLFYVDVRKWALSECLNCNNCSTVDPQLQEARAKINELQSKLREEEKAKFDNQLKVNQLSTELTETKVSLEEKTQEVQAVEESLKEAEMNLERVKRQYVYSVLSAVCAVRFEGLMMLHVKP